MQSSPNPPAPAGLPETARMPGALIFVLVIVTVHALGTAFGGWAILQENHSKQEHGQDLLMPMGMAWFVALFCWGLAALQVVCVVLVRRRRPWVRVVLAGWLIFVAFLTVLSFIGSLAAGAPSLAVLMIFGIDVVALWVVLGETAHRWFSVRSPAPTSPQGRSPMDHPTYEHDPYRPPTEPLEPSRAPTPCDPVAAALGNASLLGIGYLLLGHWRLAALAVLGTGMLLGLTASTAATWCEILLLLWWAAGIAHGWFLARGRAEHVVRRGQRAGVLAVTVAVLLTAVLLRVDAYGIEDRVNEAREGGDCTTAVAAQGEVWFGHRLAGAPVVEPGDAVVEACHRPKRAASTLADAGRKGNIEDLERGFGILTRVLRKPGNEKTVKTVLDTFLDGLPTQDSCDTAAITGWLRDREPTRDVLDRSADTATRTDSSALLGCGDDLMDEDDWGQARARYQRLLNEYPDDARTDEARSGVEKATLAIELDKVRSLVENTFDAKSGYCHTPARYSGAPPYRKGFNRALFLGDTEYTDRLPGDWRTGDPAKAALVVCADTAKNGDVVETCYYENDLSEYLPHEVTFHKVKIPLKVYELRTGKRVDSREVQISGGSCPSVLHYEYYGTLDPGPGGDEFVSTAKSDVRDAFRPVVKR